MLTLNSPVPTVNKLEPVAGKKAYTKKKLPEEKIRQLYYEGIGYKAIASWLKKTQSIDVSVMTI